MHVKWKWLMNNLAIIMPYPVQGVTWCIFFLIKHEFVQINKHAYFISTNKGQCLMHTPDTTRLSSTRLKNVCLWFITNPSCDLRDLFLLELSIECRCTEDYIVHIFRNFLHHLNEAQIECTRLHWMSMYPRLHSTHLPESSTPFHTKANLQKYGQDQ